MPDSLAPSEVADITVTFTPGDDVGIVVGGEIGRAFFCRVGFGQGVAGIIVAASPPKLAP